MASSQASGAVPSLSMLASSATDVVFSATLSTVQVVQNLHNYRKVALQRWVVRIIFMVPIYSISESRRQGSQVQSRQAVTALPPPPLPQSPRDRVRSNSFSRNVYGGIGTGS